MSATINFDGSSFRTDEAFADVLEKHAEALQQECHYKVRLTDGVFARVGVPTHLLVNPHKVSFILEGHS